MNAQQRLSELDAVKLHNIQLRQQILTGDLQAFQGHVFEAYGNEGERLAVQEDGSIVRTPNEKPAPAGKKARK